MRSEHKRAVAVRATSAARPATRAEWDAIAAARDAAAAAARDASDALRAARRRVDALVAMAAGDKAAGSGWCSSCSCDKKTLMGSSRIGLNSLDSSTSVGLGLGVQQMGSGILGFNPKRVAISICRRIFWTMGHAYPGDMGAISIYTVNSVVSLYLTTWRSLISSVEAASLVLETTVC
jgi:hypothetical protein